MGLENNYIDESVIQEKVAARIIAPLKRGKGQGSSKWLAESVKVHLVVTSGKGTTFQQREGDPPSPEDAPPPKSISYNAIPRHVKEAEGIVDERSQRGTKRGSAGAGRDLAIAPRSDGPRSKGKGSKGKGSKGKDKGREVNHRGKGDSGRATAFPSLRDAGQRNGKGKGKVKRE